MPAGIPLDHFHRWGCDGKRLLHGISIDWDKKVSGFARGSSAVPLGEGKASSPSQSNPSDLPAPPKGGAFDAFARFALYLETVPLLLKAPPSGKLANEREPERVWRAKSKRKAFSADYAQSKAEGIQNRPCIINAPFSYDTTSTPTPTGAVRSATGRGERLWRNRNRTASAAPLSSKVWRCGKGFPFAFGAPNPLRLAFVRQLPRRGSF